MTTTSLNTDAILVDLDPWRVSRVYSGKPGCGCGCRGKYYDDPRNVRRIVAWMKRLAEAGTELVRCGVDGTCLDDKDVYFVETEGRYLWAYATPRPAEFANESLRALANA